MRSIFMDDKQARTTSLKLYIVTCGAAHKVGVSNDPQRRLQGIQVGCPWKAELVRIYNYRDADALCAERWIHITFSNYNTNGEWFSAPLEKIFSVSDKLWEMYSIRCEYDIDRTLPAANQIFPILRKETDEEPQQENIDNEIEKWIKRECAEEVGKRIDRTILYRKYEQSQHNNEKEAMPRNSFYKMLRKLGFSEIQAHGSRYFRGLTLKEA